MKSSLQSPMNREWRLINQFVSPASHGNSGGPFLNDQGDVFGVVTRGIPGEQLNYAVPIEELYKMSSTEAEFSHQRATIDGASGRVSWPSTALVA